jgi:hypothetical protein
VTIQDDFQGKWFGWLHISFARTWTTTIILDFDDCGVAAASKQV